MSSPSIHNLGKIWKIRRCWVWILTSYVLISGDIPKVPPFGIKWRRTWSVGFILRTIWFEDIFMISTFFCKLWSSSNLIIVLWEDFLDRFVSIKLLSSIVKVFFHHVKELGILWLINSGIFDDKAAKFVKGFCNLLAIGFGGGSIS